MKNNTTVCNVCAFMLFAFILQLALPAIGFAQLEVQGEMVINDLVDQVTQSYEVATNAGNDLVAALKPLRAKYNEAFDEAMKHKNNPNSSAYEYYKQLAYRCKAEENEVFVRLGMGYLEEMRVWVDDIDELGGPLESIFLEKAQSGDVTPAEAEVIENALAVCAGQAFQLDQLIPGDNTLGQDAMNGINQNLMSTFSVTNNGVDSKHIRSAYEKMYHSFRIYRQIGAQAKAELRQRLDKRFKESDVLHAMVRQDEIESNVDNLKGLIFDLTQLGLAGMNGDIDGEDDSRDVMNLFSSDDSTQKSHHRKQNTSRRKASLYKMSQGGR